MRNLVRSSENAPKTTGWHMSKGCGIIIEERIIYCGDGDGTLSGAVYLCDECLKNDDNCVINEGGGK